MFGVIYNVIRKFGSSPPNLTNIASLVRKSLPISLVVEKYLNLNRTGTTAIGQCPFHDDNQPSLGVTDHKGLYHCFSCGASGDVVKFIKEMERYSFREALIYLVDEYKVELPNSFSQHLYKTPTLSSSSSPFPTDEEDVQVDHKKLKEWSNLLEAASNYYAHCLLEDNQEAGWLREYLRKRGISAGVAYSFKIGYSPLMRGVGDSGVVKNLMNQNFSIEDMVHVGLIGERNLHQSNSQNNTKSTFSYNNHNPEWNYVDKMRGRLVIPIRSRARNVIG